MEKTTVQYMIYMFAYEEKTKDCLLCDGYIMSEPWINVIESYGVATIAIPLKFITVIFKRRIMQRFK